MINSVWKFKNIVIFLLSVWTTSVFAIPSKKVCTITLNSIDERDIFHRHLTPLNWQFQELVPSEIPANQSIGQNQTQSQMQMHLHLQKKNSHWLKQSCDPNLRCDVLLISGHFAGSFFGSSPYRLAIEDLEELSCDSSCDGIIKQPKEVHLYGCNTLASKDKDSRTPEEYMAALLRDGFSGEQASQIVSFRYSDFGDSFRSRMESVFSQTPQIYGFSSKSPLGKNIRPMLENYLEQSSARYESANFDRLYSATNVNRVKPNTSLQRHLKVTKFTQSQGKSSRSRFCTLRDSNRSVFERLTFLQSLFEQGDALGYLEHVDRFFKSIENQKNDPTVVKAIESLAQSRSVRRQLLSVLSLNGSVYLPNKILVLNTMSEIGLISKSERDTKIIELLQLSEPVLDDHRATLCSIGTELPISARLIPEERWSEMNFLAVLMCLKVSDRAVQARMIEMMQTHKDPAFRATAIWYFSRVSPEKRDPQVRRLIIEMMARDPDVNVRKSAELVLREILNPR